MIDNECFVAPPDESFSADRTFQGFSVNLDFVMRVQGISNSDKVSDKVSDKGDVRDSQNVQTSD